MQQNPAHRISLLPVGHSMQDVFLIWLDNSINECNQYYHQTVSQLRQVVNTVRTFTDANQCIEFIKTIVDQKIYLIISGSLGQQLMPTIHNISQVDSILIFCGNKAHHELWSKNWPKIKGVFIQMPSICEFLRQAMKEHEENAIVIRSLSTGDEMYNKNSNQLHCSFMYTQILKDLILSLEFKQRHMHEFVMYCREKIFADNDYQLQNIKTFERNYSTKTPIWWYTSEGFLYSMLNHSLRTMEVNTIIKMGFFIDALHRQIEILHSQQFSNHDSKTNFIVYRGQGLSKKHFDMLKTTEGKLISFNNFLSTSRNRDVSLEFADQALHNPDMIGILFVMTIDPSKSTAPFASITDVSYYEKEDEVLFSMHTIFRTCGIERLSENDRLFQIKLIQTNDDDNDLRQLTEYIKEELKGSTGWHRLSAFLLKLGRSDKAQQVIQIVSDQTADETEVDDSCSAVTSNSERSKDEQRPFARQESISASDCNTIESCDHCGGTYYRIEKYARALTFFEKMITLQQKSLPPNHPDVALSYNKIGNTYYGLRQYEKAMTNYRQAIQIQQQSLPLNHSDLAFTYGHIGKVYQVLQDYSNALLFFQSAVEIGKHSLSPTNTDLKKWQKDLEYIRNRQQRFVIT